MTRLPELGPVGIWSPELRFGDPAETADAAAELGELGFGALWIPDIGGPVLESVEHLLLATTRVTVATGILNVWMHEAVDVAHGQERLERDFPGRFLLGLGISHAPIVDAEQPGRYRRPLATMREYLDALDDIRLLQDFIVERARSSGAPVVENASIELSIGTVMELVLSEAERFAKV